MNSNIEIIQCSNCKSHTSYLNFRFNSKGQRMKTCAKCLNQKEKEIDVLLIINNAVNFVVNNKNI